MAGKIAAPSKRGRLEVNPDPNVIPFIDVMLVLVIIFMIAAPISSVDIEVEMPVSRIDPSQRPPRPTWVSISSTDEGVLYYVMNDAVAINELGTKVFEAVQKNDPRLADEDEVRDQRVFIRADAGLPYRNVVLVMNRLQDRGFTKIGFVAEDRRN